MDVFRNPWRLNLDGQWASLPYWNGWIRLTFVIATFTLGFGESAGVFISLLALGDLPLALGAILGLPWVLGRSHLALVLNRSG